MPRLHALQADYGPHGFTSITVNVTPDNWGVINPYARLYASLYLRDDGTFWDAYKQNDYVPLNYVIDTAGVVRYAAEGWDEAPVKQVIEQYLPNPTE